MSTDRQPRVWETSADLPQDEPGLRIRDRDGDEATCIGDVRWKWDFIDDDPSGDSFRTDGWESQPVFPVTEILTEGQQ